MKFTKFYIRVTKFINKFKEKLNLKLKTAEDKNTILPYFIIR